MCTQGGAIHMVGDVIAVNCHFISNEAEVSAAKRVRASMILRKVSVTNPNLAHACPHWRMYV